MVSKILAAASLVALPTAVYAGLSTNGTTTTTTADQPNILVLLPDEWRWDWAGFDGNVETPIINGLAAGGVRFSHAVTPTPLCDPARASLALGREYDESTIDDNLLDLPLDMDNIFRTLQSVGYHIMVTGKDDLTKVSGVGDDGSYNAAELGFDAYGRCDGKPASFMPDTPTDPYGWAVSDAGLYPAAQDCYMGDGTTPGCCTDASVAGVGLIGETCETPDAVTNQSLYWDDWTRDESVRLLDEKPPNTPWFMQVNFPGPHPPFIITAEMNASIMERDESTFNRAADPLEELTDDLDLSIRRQYAAEIEHIDYLMGTLLDKLDELSERNNTIVVVMADHGEELGDHGNYGKQKPWSGSYRVPFIFNGPGISSGRVVDSPVTTLDIGGTFFESAGVDRPDGMTTTSLWPTLAEDELVRDHVTTGYGNWRGAIKKYNDSTTLKLVCCSPPGCPNPPSMLPLHESASKHQLIMYNTTGDPYDLDELGCLKPTVDKDHVCPPEAAELVKLLPMEGYSGDWVTNCTATLDDI